MPFSNLTIVSVTGSDAYAEGSAWAVIRSCEELPGAKGLLISPTCPANFPQKGNFEHQPCRPFSYLEYSIFMLYNLAQYIETDYCLVVQNDGWVINGKNWLDEFWRYDYIGAPVVADMSVRKDEFGQDYIHINRNTTYFFNPDLFPQNGGFSLRSKRLLEMPRKLGLALNIRPTKLAEPIKPFKIDWDELPIHNEDLFLTIVARQQLENAGINFAPFSTANHFSFESSAVPKYCKIPYEKYLGHHFFYKTELVGYDKIRTKYPKEWIQNSGIKQDILDMLNPFVQKGYHITIDTI